MAASSHGHDDVVRVLVLVYGLMEPIDGLHYVNQRSTVIHCSRYILSVLVIHMCNIMCSSSTLFLSFSLYISPMPIFFLYLNHVLLYLSLPPCGV